jgi:sterol desaturase/sphingolipid hydroxylase (fatty acid hydroxylase superfamily)
MSNMIPNPISSPVRALIIGTWLGVLVWWERHHALRRTVDSKVKRDVRNMAVAALAGAVVQFVEVPVAFGLAQQVQEKRWGLIQQLPLLPFARVIVAVVLLDYTLYLWHVLTHRVPLLWRFHEVHHVDREMDATTALRFHFGEVAISVLFRAAQVLTIGPAPIAVASWQVFLFLCILFHHSNLRLPLGLERRLARLIVTPRLHGIHHSIAPADMNSNWSSGFTVWDWLHGTLRTQVPQDSIVIGVAGHRGDLDQRLANVLALPFRESADVPEMPDHAVRQPLSALK